MIWHKASEELPPVDGYPWLCWCNEAGCPYQVYYFGEFNFLGTDFYGWHGFYDDDDTYEVDYWADLPDPPKED